MIRVVLGSASAGRFRVLRQAGLDPLVILSEIDEDALIASLDHDTPPEAVVTKLANAEAVAVAAQLPQEVAADFIVLGCVRCCSTTTLFVASQDPRKGPATMDFDGRDHRILADRACAVRISNGVISYTQRNSERHSALRDTDRRRTGSLCCQQRTNSRLRGVHGRRTGRVNHRQHRGRHLQRHQDQSAARPTHGGPVRYGIRGALPPDYVLVRHAG